MKTPIEIYVIEPIRRMRLEEHISQAMLAYGIGVTKVLSVRQKASGMTQSMI
ncbi:MAG: hypothetical protein LBR52_05480 [Prevotellaceae bacterium]|jgi:DNA-binding XRE family transcriptional regulator|nr:hypothetical protein [Prevotellaceae bacterium]